MRLFIVLMLSSFFVHSQSITAWTEANGELGLGYPVPIPVDTPEPFDGFRSYDGLFAKHQSLAMNNPYITGHIVGQSVYERDIWAYILSDEDDLTQYGVKEGVMLINGGIHAREWQSPEVLTGIMELLNDQANDHWLHQFLLENTAIVAIPVNNVDGFIQTQAYPTTNWYSVEIGPRDGRMRRKNMLNVDEVLETQSDFLLGIDLNRNNNPFWATSTSSSFDSSSIVYHGRAPHSEPETFARLTAADLIDSNQMRIYTDVHSFSTVHFSIRTNNSSRNSLQSTLLRDFTNHHRSFPANKNYVDTPNSPGRGLGLTSEYFAYTNQVPSWTLEIEPNFNNAGVEYGGFGNNAHDGFILPESQIRRVREQLAQTFMITWYGQAGPPSITKLRIVEKDTATLIYDVDWNTINQNSSEYNENIIENLENDKEYTILVSFDKPMRKRSDNGEVVALQGQQSSLLLPEIKASVNTTEININFNNIHWINTKDQSINSYLNYKDDTFSADFIIPSDLNLADGASINWKINATDMIGQGLDADPSTVLTWSGGKWINYENTNGLNSLFGGIDSSYQTVLSATPRHTFVPLVQPTGLYYDPSRDGEGFSYELLQGLFTA